MGFLESLVALKTQDYKLYEKRIEFSRSTIVCSQREPESWKAMIMNDEVSANAIL